MGTLAYTTHTLPSSASLGMSIPEPPKGHTRPIVFFDVAIGDTKLPRIKIELFDDIVPK